MVATDPATQVPDYEREDWMTGWLDIDGDCQDTRQEVLIAESLVDVTFETEAKCRVSSGRWLGAYTGDVFTDPRDLDVDHFVPLKNSHESGGWLLSPGMKAAYANELNHEPHLIAVSASANRSKGSEGPEEWRPPDTGYWCQYAIDWASVKSRWNLSMTVAEADAIEQMVDTCEEPVDVLRTEVAQSVGEWEPVATTVRPASDCDPAYPSVCIPPPPPDLDCSEIADRRFTVLQPDPHGFDANNDGVGCEN